MAEATKQMRSPRGRAGRLTGLAVAVVAAVATLVAAIAVGWRRLGCVPNPLAGGMAKYYAFRVAGAIVPHLPARLVYGAAAPAGALFWALAPTRRARAERNLRHVPTLAADSVALRRAVRGVFRYLILNYLDFLREGHLTDAEIWATCHVENEAAFHTLVAEGRGMVVLVPHSSAFELAAARLAVMGYQVVIPMERLQPEPLFAYFRRSRERLGVRFLPADSRETLHEIMRVLRSGGVLVFAVDRLITGASVELPLFGEPVKVPITPAALALRMGARVGAAFPYRLAPERGEILFVPLASGAEVAGPTSGMDGTGQMEAVEGGRTLDRTGERTAEKTADKTEAGVRLQRRFLAELERFLTRHPEQWVSALSPVWQD
jgi:lauroyl/myristoyl acyltransferase